jgi:hypothetical protein
VKVGGKQSNRLAGISDYKGNRKEIEDSKSVPVGSPMGQNETTILVYFSTLKMEAICSTETSAWLSTGYTALYTSG